MLESWKRWCLLLSFQQGRRSQATCLPFFCRRCSVLTGKRCWRHLNFSVCIAGPDKSKKNPLAHWASKIFFHLPISNSYLPRICMAQIPICPRFANRNRSPTFNIALTSLWKQYSCKSQLIYRKSEVLNGIHKFTPFFFFRSKTQIIGTQWGSFRPHNLSLQWR